MSTFLLTDMTSYLDTIGSLVASFTLAEWSVLAGIVTGLATCAANLAYMRRKDAREQRQAELAEREAMARLGSQTRSDSGHPTRQGDAA